MLGLVASFALAMAQLSTPENADLAIVRLEPGRFTDLPAHLRRELERRGCTVPQTFAGGRPHNVISGRFRTASQVDWAVVCSRDRTSSILVFWGGSPQATGELSARPDAHYFQDTGGGRIGYSRTIRRAHPRDIRRWHREFGGPTPPPLDHDGIEDLFLDKASTVFYWHRGKWLKLTGMD